MIHVCEHHDTVLRHWRAADRSGIALAHVDFHDDLRGLLVDRKRKRSYAIGKLARGEAPLDAGNFLAHAVLEGRVRSVHWVHGEPGGRAWDAGIVRYESDLFALPQRLRHRLAGGDALPFEFQERTIDDWAGPREGELLSVDWDCFASILTDAGGIAGRVERFFERLGDPVPADSWVVYSPEYSHPSLAAFRGFVERLGERFGQAVEWLDPALAEGETSPTGVAAGLPTDPLMRLVLFLRRRGIY